MVSYLIKHGLRLLTADKEGGSVVQPGSFYGEGAAAAIMKNFKFIKGVSLRHEKRKGAALCESLNLSA